MGKVGAQSLAVARKKSPAGGHQMPASYTPPFLAV